MQLSVEALGCSWYGFDLNPKSSGIFAWNLLDPCPFETLRPDVVLLLDVIEHLANPGSALANIAKLLRPGGRLVMTMPNPRWSRSRIHALLHGNPACFTQTDLDLNNHMFTPWPHIITRMLGHAGLEVEDYVTLDGKTEWPKNPFSLRYPLRVLNAFVCKIVERFDPSACGMSYGVLARRCD